MDRLQAGRVRPQPDGVSTVINGKEVRLLEALKVRAESKRQAAAIHAYRVRKRYGKPIRTRSDAEAFLAWLRAESLSDCTVASLMTHYRQCSGGNGSSVFPQAEVAATVGAERCAERGRNQAVLCDLETNESSINRCF